ncbi:MAG: hypothetical protein KDI33_00170 [Halioglobus sp.]|nr:hypothetical protein [Halioglobus sp.]
MNLAQAQRPESTLQTFEFRAIAPAFVDEELQLLIKDHSADKEHGASADTTIDLEARNHRGELIMSASAHFVDDAA